jgi:hypothetical protein
MTLIEVFDHLSSVLQYFVPGYCTLWVFSWCRSKKERSESITFILSCVISYVLLTIVEFANDTFIHAELSTLVKSFWACFRVATCRELLNQSSFQILSDKYKCGQPRETEFFVASLDNGHFITEKKF